MPDRPDGQPVDQSQAPVTSSDSAGGADWGASTGEEHEQYRQLPPAYWGDRRFYRLVLWFLGLISLATVASVIWFHAIGKPNPDALIAMGSASVGALVSLVSVHSRR